MSDQEIKVTSNDVRNLLKHTRWGKCKHKTDLNVTTDIEVETLHETSINIQLTATSVIGKLSWLKTPIKQHCSMWCINHFEVLESKSVTLDLSIDHSGVTGQRTMKFQFWSIFDLGNQISWGVLAQELDWTKSKLWHNGCLVQPTRVDQAIPESITLGQVNRILVEWVGPFLSRNKPW